jgi:signal transduction histidine kinase
MSRSLRVAVAAVVVTAAVDVVSTALVVTAATTRGILLLGAAVVLGTVPALAGLVVARSQGQGLLGPLLVLPGLLAALVVLGALLPTDSTGSLAGTGDAITVASQGAWILVFVVIALPLLFFPGGRVATRFGRWLVGLILADAAVFMVVAATAPGAFMAPNQDTPHVFGTMPGALATVLTVISLPGLPLTLVALAIHVVGQYRAGDARSRRRLRWPSLGAALLPATLLATWLSYALTGSGTVVLVGGLTIVYMALPGLLAIGAVRPELLDIDHVLAGTVAHGVFTAALLAVYTAVDLATGQLLVHRAPTVAVAATALCALLLVPARGWIQQRIDRWLYPARKAAYSAIAELHRESLGARARPEQLQSRLRPALREESLVVGYRSPLHETLVDAAGNAVTEPGEWHVVPISLGGERIGALLAPPTVSWELLRDVAARASPLVELVRLRMDLRLAILQADESRARMLRAGYEERVRLERDLHDGAQQRLVSLGVALRLTQRQVARGDVDVVEVAGILDQAVAELGTTVSELRQLAHGIRPSCLDDGLLAALSSLVSSTPVPISLQVAVIDLDPDLETTAYYVAAEAITNAVKHAEAQHIALDVSAAGGELYVRVTDDGSGMAAVREGSGLAGLADRVGAQGGRLAVNSRRGLGTVIEAVMPCVSS